MQRHAGIKLLTWVGRLCTGCRGQATPQYGERRYIVPRGKRWYVLHWLASVGWRVTSCGPPGLPAGAVRELWLHDQGKAMLKRRQAPAEGTPAIPLESESVILHDCPLLRQFLTHTAYSDMSPRQPGYMTIRTRGLAFEMTLYDYDSGMRLVVQGPCLDDMFAAGELMLGTDAAPWTVDQYLTGLLQKKTKKK